VYTVENHIWRTADGDLVEHGNPDAAILAYPAGTEVADDEAKKLGLADVGKAKPDTKAAPKAKPAPANKAVDKPADK
jgi:hypothetical protein